MEKYSLIVLIDCWTSFEGDFVNKCSYYMAESVFAMRLVNLRSVTCYTDQNL